MKRFPFDWKSRRGYLVSIILEFMIWTYEHIVLSCTLSLAVGGYWLTISTTEEFQRIVSKLNDEAQKSVYESNALKILFAEFIDLHATIKQLSVCQRVRYRGVIQHNFNSIDSLFRFF